MAAEEGDRVRDRGRDGPAPGRARCERTSQTPQDQGQPYGSAEDGCLQRGIAGQVTRKRKQAAGQEGRGPAAHQIAGQQVGEEAGQRNL